MGCYDAQVIQRITAIRLDECGRIPLVGSNPTPALKGLETDLQTFGLSRQVELAPDNRTKLVNGGTCSKPRGTPTDSGYSSTLTFCGGNPVFEAIVGYKTLDLFEGNIVGFEEVELTGATNVALEVIFKPSADACEPGADPKCIALLIPMLESWIKSGEQNYNGNDVPDLAMTGTTRLNKNLFGNYLNDTELPAYLAHWAPKFAAVGTGRAWTYTYLIDCPDDEGEHDPCQLVALDEGS